MELTNIAPRVFDAVGEGPHYVSETGELIMVDLVAVEKSGSCGSIIRGNYLNPKLEFEKLNTGEAPISFAIPSTKDTLIVGIGQNIVEYEWPRDGSPATYKTIHAVEEGLLTRFNDGKCDSRGRLVTGTMGKETAPGVVCKEEIGSIYGLDLDRSLHVLDTKYTISNGIAWTRDERSMFFVDSYTRHVYVFDYDMENFKAKNRRVLFDLTKHSDLATFYPDGCCIDTQDRLWLALFKGSLVVCVDTKTGQRVSEIKIPTSCPTSCCFAGPHLDELIVPSSVTGSQDGDLEAGSVYRVVNTGAKGVPSVKFHG